MLQSTTTNFVSLVNMCYKFCSYLSSSGIRYMTFKSQNAFIFQICETSQIVQVIIFMQQFKYRPFFCFLFVVFLCFMSSCLWAGIAQSVQRLTTGWTSGDRVPVGMRYSIPIQTGVGVHPASCTMGTGSFLGAKRSVRGIDHPPPSGAEAKERGGLYIYSPTGSSWPVPG